MEAQQQQQQQQQSYRGGGEPSSPVVATNTGSYDGSAPHDTGELLYPISESPAHSNSEQHRVIEEEAAAEQSRYGLGSTSIEQQAIRILYEEFRQRAAGKIDAIVELRHDREPDLAKYLEQGADRAFDRTVEKLGSLARRRPRVIIELLLVWRKTTIEAADDWAMDVGGEGGVGGSKHSQQARSHYVAKERRSLASVYILCRALSAVVAQLEASHLEGDLGDRLEELVFSQVKQVNSANLRRSQNRRDIQDLYARLIGRISEIRFASMSDRFIAELERIPMVSGSGDERIVILLHNMRFLRLRVYPIDALEESSAFLLSCAKFYSRTSGSLRLKHAWAALLTELLMPIAAVVDAEVNLPELVQAIDIIYAKAMKMAAKVRHVTAAFPLAAATLCISRRDMFHQRWLSLLEFCIQRLKDKQFRRVSMDAILRMLWVYLFRYPEASSVVLRRIDSLSRIFFPATKLHAWPKTVPPAAFVYFIVCAGCYSFDFAMRQLLQGMLQIDSGWPGTTRDIADAAPLLDTLNPARVAIAFQALVGISAIAANGARRGDGDSEPGGDKQPPLLRPPFPGVGQLSGLENFGFDSPSTSGSDASVSVLGNSSTSSRGGGGPGGSIATAVTSSGYADSSGPSRSRHGGTKPGTTTSGTAKHKSASDSDNTRISDHPVTGVIYSSQLPDNIRTALRTGISVVTRYCNVLYPVFGHYVLADDRLWRQTRTVPPFSSIVLSGSPFNIENTMLLTSGTGAGGYRDHRTLHGSGSQSNAVVVAGGSDLGSGNGSTGVGGNAGSLGASGTGGGVGGGTSGGRQTAAGSTPSASRVLVSGADDDMADSFYLDSPGGGHGADGTSVNGSGDMASSVLAATIRQTTAAASRYPPERQVYVDLLATYALNVPRAQVFWEQADTARLVDSLVQNVLHVDQTLAATSRLCLLQLLNLQQPIAGGATGRMVSVFASKAERLSGIRQAVVRATQLLRATDERFSEILAGGIYAQDAHSYVSYAQPGDQLPLSSDLLDLPLDLPLIACGESAGFRRFAHMSSLSTASTASNPAGIVGVGYDESADAPAGSLLGADDEDSDVEPSPTALDTKAARRLHTSIQQQQQQQQQQQRSARLASDVLNGGFLHFYLDLISCLETALCEWISETPQPPGFADSSSSQHQPTELKDQPLVGSQAENQLEWARLACAIEANGIALLCSSSVRVRRLAVNVLYQAGVVRRILANQPSKGRGEGSSQCAYDILNVQVPAKLQPLETEFFTEPFGTEDSGTSRSAKSLQPLARMASSIRENDICVWDQQFPDFVRRIGAMAPETMAIARTLVSQRLYQMQPLMRQYAEMSIRSGNLGTSCCSAGSVAFLRLGAAYPHDKAAAAVFRPDFVTAFGHLLLFAVVSLPADEAAAAAAIAAASSSAIGSSSGVPPFDNDVGSTSANGGIFGHNTNSNNNNANSSSSGGSGAGVGRSRLAKSIARKLAPLKANSRNN
ncbi:Cell morphogenesis protein PAG1, partial [Coemansia sp. RSA 1933]